MQRIPKEEIFDSLLKIGLDIDDSIKLTVATKELARELFGLVDGNREFFKNSMGRVNNFLTEQDSFQLLESWSQEYPKRKKISFLIQAKEINVVTIGFLSYKTIDLQSGDAEIGYMMDQHWCGKGILRKCLQRLLDIGFEGMELQRVNLVTATDNERSINVGKKLGFRIINEEKGQITINDIQKDKVTMQLDKLTYFQQKQ